MARSECHNVYWYEVVQWHVQFAFESVYWQFETDIRKKRLLNYSIDFGICIFCGNCVEYCPTNCLSMTEEYELSTYDRHELNYNQIALGRLPISVIDDYTIRTISTLPQLKRSKPLIKDKE